MTLPAGLEEKLTTDIATRLDSDGKPKHPGNDYERHLFARSLCLKGLEKTQVWFALAELGLEDVAVNKRTKYIDDILNSVLVGFDGTLPVYQEIKG